ncbi:hypothetical protein J4Q44_G00355350 [Coregonus suidteri]|uniref:Uncharacterized protein n=1 Tax=Coregonus suidteri TaxID=861788 RepID=A0AAN8KSW5_9TELE
MERSHRPTLKPSACASILNVEGYGVGVTDRPSSTSLTSESSKRASHTERRRRHENAMEPEDDIFIPEKVFILEETVQEAEESSTRCIMSVSKGSSAVFLFRPLELGREDGVEVDGVVGQRAWVHLEGGLGVGEKGRWGEGPER